MAVSELALLHSELNNHKLREISCPKSGPWRKRNVPNLMAYSEITLPCSFISLGLEYGASEPLDWPEVA